MTILVVVVVGVVGLLGWWWWRTARTPPDRAKFVSSAWLDDHVRGRRE